MRQSVAQLGLLFFICAEGFVKSPFQKIMYICEKKNVITFAKYNSMSEISIFLGDKTINTLDLIIYRLFATCT